ncbi:MAG: hypothetical protein LC791_12755 [Acidobacteria bacterium]|nr:hypothetical protein [Acidobacteriota bacterium]
MGAFMIIGLILGIAYFPGPPIDAKALADFTRLQRELGHIVQVTDRNGKEMIATLGTADANELTLEFGRHVQRLAATEIAHIERRGDSVVDGAIKGALIGLILGTLTAQGAETPGDTWKVFLGSMGLYGSLGVLIDHGHDGWTSVYRSPPAPSIAMRVRW